MPGKRTVWRAVINSVMADSRLTLVVFMSMLIALAVSCTTKPAQNPSPTAPPIISSQPEALVQATLKGGLVVFLRHGATDRSIEASLSGPSWWKSCDPFIARQLSDKGRNQAHSIGRAFKELGIPVGIVYSSEYCRAIETATLAFGRTATVFELNWLTSEGDEPTDLSGHKLAVQELLSTKPLPDTNTVIVGHSFNLEGVSSVTIEEGEAALFQPLGGGKFNLLGKLSPENLEKYISDMAGTER